MRRMVIASAIVLASSCGSGMPASPDSSPAPRAVSIPAGPYLLTITPSQSGISPPSVCSGTMATTVVHVPVDAERGGDLATLRASGTNTNLVVEFRITNATVFGTISGSATDLTGNRITATGDVTGAAPPDTAVIVAGNINGSISTAGGFCANNGHMWSLSTS